VTDGRVMKIIMCRSGSDSLEVGSMLGYYCEICHCELQVSLTGRLQIDAGGKPVCNACGLHAVTRLQNEGKLQDVRLNPQAVRTMERWEREDAEKKKPECDVCSRKVERYWCWKVRAVCPLGTVLGRRFECPADTWWLCDQCRPLWEAGAAEALGARAEILVMNCMPGAGREMARMYAVLLSAIASGPTVAEVTR